MIKACIFDLDGVIVDTAKYHYLAWKRLANQLGFVFSEKDNEQLKGVSRMTSLEILLKTGTLNLSEEKKIELAAQKNEWYLENIHTMNCDSTLPGVRDFLNELKSNGFLIALGSSSKNAKTILKKINLIEYFDVIIDGTCVSNAKPDPEIFSKGIEELNLLPNETVVFEDAEAGIEAALNAKTFAVGVGNPEILHKAHYVIPGFENFSIEVLKEVSKKYFV